MSANNQSAQGGDNHINLYEPHVWKHHTKVAGLEWKNPVGTASGTFQYAAVRWFYDVSQARRRMHQGRLARTVGR